MTRRILDWDGNYNVRDLGGLPGPGGGTTRFGEIVRSAAAFQLTEAGWAAAHAYGIRTVVDLMNPREYTEDAHPRPADITTIRIPLDNEDDTEFWAPLIKSGQWGTAIYYRPFLDRYPETVAAVVTAIAAAGSAVLFHCGRGQDRTGLISMVLLALAGVKADAIADDYELCKAPETVRLLVAHGQTDDADEVCQILALAGTTNRDAIVETLTAIDIDTYLREAGNTRAELDSLRRRLIAG
jgi:protein-tyrosine phosphatase